MRALADVGPWLFGVWAVLNLTLMVSRVLSGAGAQAPAFMRRRLYDRALNGWRGVHVTVGAGVEDDELTVRQAHGPARVRFDMDLVGDGLLKRRVHSTEYSATLPGFTRGVMRVSSPDARVVLDPSYGEGVVNGALVIQSNPRALAAEVLNPEAREVLGRLSALSEGTLWAQVRSGRVIIRVGRPLLHAYDLRRFIVLCGELTERLGPPAAPRLALSDRATCVVCGTEVRAGHRVLCMQCRTPAHEDCWDYNDGCAIFACGGRRMTRA